MPSALSRPFQQIVRTLDPGPWTPRDKKYICGWTDIRDSPKNISETVRFQSLFCCANILLLLLLLLFTWKPRPPLILSVLWWIYYPLCVYKLTLYIETTISKMQLLHSLFLKIWYIHKIFSSSCCESFHLIGCGYVVQHIEASRASCLAFKQSETDVNEQKS